MTHREAVAEIVREIAVGAGKLWLSRSAPTIEEWAAFKAKQTARLLALPDPPELAELKRAATTYQRERDDLNGKGLASAKAVIALCEAALAYARSIATADEVTK